MNTIDYNQRWEDEWDDMKKYGPYARHIRRLVHSVLDPLQFSTVLDVGCGQGALLQEICTARPNTTPAGVDISQVSIELSSLRIPSGRFSVLNVSEQKLFAQFDLVTCIDVLEHIQDDAAAIHNLAAMTGRYLLVSSVQGRMRKIEPRAWGHVRNYKRGELVGKIEGAGLSVIQLIEWGFPFYSPLYRDFINLVGPSGANGQYGLARKLIAHVLYTLFKLNSSKRGDVIMVLAHKPSLD